MAFLNFLKPKKTFFLLILIIPFCLAILSQDQEVLDHKVSVTAYLMPLFAVDSKGEPVYDLKKEDLELYVKGKRIKILYFERFTFEYEKEIEKTIVKKEKEKKIPIPNERIKFIIIDNIFNSYQGFRRSKKIAEELVKMGDPIDSFILLKVTPGGGLGYIFGPEKNKNKMLKSIRKLKPTIESRLKQIHSSEQYMVGQIDQGIYDPRDLKFLGPNYYLMAKRLKEGEKSKNLLNLRKFSHALLQFKYALKTIKKPKIVFLISEGLSRGMFNEGWDLSIFAAEGMIAKDRIRRSTEGMTTPNFSIFFKDEFNSLEQKNLLSAIHFDYLKGIAKSINYGGSILNVINPRKFSPTDDRTNSGEMSLNYLAKEAGGKYFEGSSIKTIVKQIKKLTGAYYNLAFMVDQISEQKTPVKIRCKKEGVKIQTLKHIEKEESYEMMPLVQKKLFALNVITGGTWSRMLGKVKKMKLKTQKREKTSTNQHIYLIDAQMPVEMHNRDADIFILHIQPKTNRVDFDIKRKKVKEREKLEITCNPKQKIFVVIVEPKTPFCVYTKIQ